MSDAPHAYSPLGAHAEAKFGDTGFSETGGPFSSMEPSCNSSNLQACLDNIDVNGEHSLHGLAFKILGIFRDNRIVPYPRYDELSPWLLRLSKTEYSRVTGNLTSMKLLLHLDGYMNAANIQILDLSIINPKKGLTKHGCLSMLRVSIREILRRNPPRYRHKRPPPEVSLSPREQALEDNLKFNEFLSEDPDHVGPLYSPVKDTVFNILNVEKPDIQVTRAINRHESNLVRLRMGYDLKGKLCTRKEYVESKASVRRFQYVTENVFPCIRRLMEWRRLHYQLVFDGMEDLLPCELYARMLRFKNTLETSSFQDEEDYGKSFSVADEEIILKKQTLRSSKANALKYLAKVKEMLEI